MRFQCLNSQRSGNIINMYELFCKCCTFTLSFNSKPFYTIRKGHISSELRSIGHFISFNILILFFFNLLLFPEGRLKKFFKSNESINLNLNDLELWLHLNLYRGHVRNLSNDSHNFCLFSVIVLVSNKSNLDNGGF